MWQKFITALTVSFCLIVGCDKDSNSSPPTSEPVSQALPTGPTTQQLLTGPRTKLDLKFAPFTLQVPTGWNMKTVADTSNLVLEGPTPTDIASISIPLQRFITADQEKALEADAQKDLAKYPDYLKSPVARDIPGTRIIEHFIVDPPLGSATPTIQWNLILCVPDGKNFTVYELRFIGLTVNQYKTDQEFLRSIVNSLTYTPPTTDPA